MGGALGGRGGAATVARETRKGLSEKAACKAISEWQEGNARDSQSVSK